MYCERNRVKRAEFYDRVYNLFSDPKECKIYDFRNGVYHVSLTGIFHSGGEDFVSSKTDVELFCSLFSDSRSITYHRVEGTRLTNVVSPTEGTVENKEGLQSLVKDMFYQICLDIHPIDDSGKFLSAYLIRSLPEGRLIKIVRDLINSRKSNVMKIIEERIASIKNTRNDVDQKVLISINDYLDWGVDFITVENWCEEEGLVLTHVGMNHYVSLC